VTAYDDRFGELYRCAYRVAFRVLGDRPEAEDVAQEALARAFLAWRRVSGYPDAWVARVAGNLAVDRGGRRVTAPEPPVVGTAPDPLVAERVDLVRAVRALPRRQREVVVLRYLADQSEETVAALLGCSVGSVKTHASRGLAALRARLDTPVGS
jgi:RNA polymerase sigma-70 factor (sigma-E family)